MLDFLKRLFLAVVIAAAVFALYRFGAWVGALTTQRTAFYFSLHAVGSWVVAVIVGIVAFFDLK